MKGFLCFVLWMLFAHAVFTAFSVLGVYVLDSFGNRAFLYIPSLQIYATMLIGYFAFKPVFEEKK